MHAAERSQHVWAHTQFCGVQCGRHERFLLISTIGGHPWYVAALARSFLCSFALAAWRKKLAKEHNDRRISLNARGPLSLVLWLRGEANARRNK